MPAKKSSKIPPVIYYPAFLNLKGKKAVVVGGGRVAERKVFSLLEAGAEVTVVSPTLTTKLLAAKNSRKINHYGRHFRKSDIKDAFIVVSATDSSEINKKVAASAPALVNVVDVPAECNFIAPSVIKRGPLTIAISTGGVSPALSKALRKEFEKAYGREFGEYLRFIRHIREKALQEIPDGNKRERFLKNVASRRIIHTLRKKGFIAVKKMVMDGFQKERNSDSVAACQRKTRR